MIGKNFATLTRGAAALMLLVLIVGCTAAPQTRPGARPQSGQTAPAVVPSDLYFGAGEDESLLRAMNGAKMDAVRKAVIDIIGKGREEANREKLDQVLYNTSNPNAFVDNDSMETLRKDRVGEKFVYEIRIRVNRPAVENTLRAHGITGAVVAGAPVATGPSGPAAIAATPGVSPPSPVAASPEERAFVARYVDSMTYMVYFNEESKEDAFLMKTAVGMANSYLVSNGKSAVDFDQIEKLKKDQQKVYEEETGLEITLIQWIAQKLNADVYIEIDAVTEGESREGNHYGSAKVSLKMFEASTGRLLGSVPYSSPRTFSRVSQFDAKANAIQSTIYRAMPVAVDQSRALVAKAFERGIRYDLVIQKTPDTRLMSRFRSRMRDRVADIEVVYQSLDETKYAVHLFGRLEELEEIVYDVADSIPGLEGMEQVMFRGKSITFNSGL